MILLDDNLLIVDLNPAAENVLGLSRSRSLRKSLLLLVDDEPEKRDNLSRVDPTRDHFAKAMLLSTTEDHHD